MQGAQPGHDLLEAERLGDVVVAAGGQAGHPVLDGVLCGEEQDGHVGVVAAHPAQHLEPVEVGQHHVERDGVRAELAGRAHGGDAVGRGAHLPALVAQRHAQQLGEVVLVVDDEHPDRRAVEALQAGGGRRLCGGHGPTEHPIPEGRGGVTCAIPVSPLWHPASAAPTPGGVSVVSVRGPVRPTAVPGAPAPRPAGSPRTPLDQLRREHDVLRDRVVAVDAREEPPRHLEADRCDVLAHDGQGRVDDVGQREVVEADQGDLPGHAESVQRPDGADWPTSFARRRSPSAAPSLSSSRCIGGLARPRVSAAT